MEKVVEMIVTYKLEALIIGFLINIFTGIIKIPIKAMAKRSDDYTKITRFIVFLPIILGFLLSFCYSYFILQSFIFDRNFISLWLSASSFSLMVYAIFEKMFSKKENHEVKENLEKSRCLIENVKEIIETVVPEEKPLNQILNTENQESKIILRGKNSEQIATKK